MEGLGRLFNVVPVATGKHISLKNASGVTFILFEAAGDQNITFKESKAGSVEQNLTTVNILYASDGVGGVWTRETSDAGSEMSDEYLIVKKNATEFDCAAIYIGADELSAGFDSIECVIDDASKICVAIIHDLNVQRAPANLAIPAV